MDGGPPQPPSRTSLVARIGRITLWSLVKVVATFIVVVLVLAVALAYLGARYSESHTRALEPYDTVRFLDQGPGWGTALEDGARQTYYYTPQGAGLKDVRYRWFLNLELP